MLMVRLIDHFFKKTVLNVIPYCQPKYTEKDWFGKSRYSLFAPLNIEI